MPKSPGQTQPTPDPAEQAGAGEAVKDAAATSSASVTPLRLRDMARPQNATEAQVAAIADQLCAIVDDNYDFRIRLDDDLGSDTLQVQKLTVLINSLLENVRRNIRDLSTLAEELEGKVRERTLKLDLIVQSSNDGVWLWNLKDESVDYSSRWRQILGLEDARLSSIDDWLSRVHPLDAERLRAAIRAHLQGSTLFLREDYRIRHADGSYRWVWCRGRCQRDATGRAVLMAGTQTDVHELRSVDPSTGLPNEQSLIASIEDLILVDEEFHAMVIGVPRVMSMKEELTADQLSSLRQAISQRLSAVLPLTANLARLSGEFYAAVIPGKMRAAELRAQVFAPVIEAFSAPFRIGRRLVWLSVTIGATDPAHGFAGSASDVIRDAWSSYRWAREEGRQTNILSDTQIEATRDRMSIQQVVRMGLQRGWFVPYFQPVVQLGTRKIAGFETLCRLEHPDSGTISPARFLSVAEDLGVMEEINTLMLSSAIEQLALWSAQGNPYDKLFLTVNLDAVHIMARDFPQTLQGQLRSKGVDPKRLKIELVESSVVGNFAAAKRQIAAIRDTGVQIALDDFGTGYSSLEYLNEMSFDLIKVDKAFVDDIENEPRKKSMVRMICALAETLGAQICVEGIETEQQMSIISGLNVALGQGYLFSKPVPQSALARVLAAN